MKIRIYSLLFCGFALGPLSAFAQQSPLLEKYRTMALDYNHDLKAAEKNIAASVEVEKSARADLKPKLSGAANFQYTENPLELTLDVPSLGLSRTVEGRQLNYGVWISVPLSPPFFLHLASMVPSRSLISAPRALSAIRCRSMGLAPMRHPPG